MTLPGVTVGHAPDLLELFDQVHFGVQASRRVGQHQIVPSRRSPLHGVEHDGTRIPALGATDDLGAGTLGPHGQLIGGRRPERVTGGQQDRVPGGRLALGQLPDGRGLAHAVHAHDQPHVGRALHTVEAQGAGLRRVEQPADGITERDQEVVTALDLLGVDPGPQVGQERVGRGHTDVGADERLLEGVPRGCVDLAGAQCGHGAAEQAPHAAQAAPVAGRDRGRLDRSLDSRFGCGLDRGGAAAGASAGASAGPASVGALGTGPALGGGEGGRVGGASVTPPERRRARVAAMPPATMASTATTTTMMMMVPTMVAITMAGSRGSCPGRRRERSPRRRSPYGTGWPRYRPREWPGGQRRAR